LDLWPRTCGARQKAGSHVDAGRLNLDDET
jgi:hypothetical protein